VRLQVCDRRSARPHTPGNISGWSTRGASKSKSKLRWCYGAETLGNKFYVRREPLSLLLVSCTGPFWYTQQIYFLHTLRLYISRGTDNNMAQYDTGRTKIPFGPFDACIWVSPFARPGLPNRRYPSPVPIPWHICRATKLSYSYHYVYHY
jgi:hypothetical protein